MNCRRCKSLMQFVWCYDTGTSGDQDVAMNIYACNDCGTVCRENVWSFKGVVWVDFDATPPAETL